MSADRSNSSVRGGKQPAAALFRVFSGVGREIARRARPSLDLALVWIARIRQRRELDRMNDHLLRDIGISRSDVEREVGKPFWRS